MEEGLPILKKSDSGYEVVSESEGLPILKKKEQTLKPSVTAPPVSTSESVSGGLGGISPSMDNLRPTPKRENDRVKGDIISKSTISLFQNNPSFKIEEPVIDKENLSPVPTINDINNPNYAKQSDDRAAIDARKIAINTKNEKALANREKYFQQLEKKGISKEGVNSIKEDLAKNEVSNALYKQAGQIVQNNPDNKQATFELAVAAQNTGRYGDALNLFTKVLSMKGDSGQSGFVQSGGLESRTELPSSDNPANSLVGLGNVMYHTGDYKGSLDYYKQALEADPTSYLAKSGVNLIEAKKGGKGIPFLSPQQVQDKIDSENQNLEAPAKQQESDKKSEQEQNRNSRYVGDIAKSIEALAGVSEDEKGKVIGWLLNPIASAGAAANRAVQGMAKKGIEEVGGAVDEALHYDYSPKDTSKTYGKKGEILDTEQEGQGQGFLHIPVKALAGAAHLAFAASPEFAKFMGATEGIKTIASQNENTKWVGDAVDVPFDVATKALNAIGIKPEEGSIGSYLEEAANLVIGGAILHSGGKGIKKAGGLIKDFASFKEASQLAAEDKLTPIQKLEYNNYLKLLNTVSLDDIEMVAKKSKTPESKVILEKIDDVKNFDAEKTKGEVENLKKDIESETDSDIKAQLQEKLSGLEQQLVSHTEKQAETIAHSVSNEIQGEELQAQIVDLEKKKEEANSETAKAAIQERIDEIKLQLPNILKQVESTPPVKVEGVGKSAKEITNEEWANADEYEFTDTESGKKYKAKVATHADGSRTIEILNQNLDNRFGGQTIKVSKDFKGTNQEAINKHFAVDAEVKKVEGVGEGAGVVKVGGTEEPKVVGDIIDRNGFYDGKEGSFTQDGQTVIFTEKGGNKEYEIGNIDEIKNNPLADHKIESDISEVGTNKEGDLVVRDTIYKNNFSEPAAAINYDKDGNIISVNLETVNGKKRTFKGQTAEDLAYQIHLKEINKNVENGNIKQEQIDSFIESEPSEERTAAIESLGDKAESNDETTLNEVIAEADKIIESGESKDRKGSNEGDNEVKIFEELDKLAEEPDNADRKKIKEIYAANPKIAEINRDFKNIVKKLEEQGKITKKCP